MEVNGGIIVITQADRALRPRLPRQIRVGILVVLLSLGALSLLVHAEADWSAILERAAPAVVLIEAKLGDDSYSYGSGAVVSADGYVLTAHHVIDGALGINVYVPTAEDQDASFTKYEASIVESSADADIAVLKISATGLCSLAIGDSSNLKLEEEIRLLGYPQQATVGVGLIIGRGVFLGTRASPDSEEDVELIQVDISPFDYGHSGGPVINAASEIVGVAVRFYSGDVEEIADKHKLAVSINTAKRFLPARVLGGEVAPAIAPQSTGLAPSTWAIYGYSSEHLFIIPGDPTVGYPIPMPRPLPVGWGGSMIVGPDGLFYCTDVDDGEIVRFDPATREPTVIFESGSLLPSDLAFDLEGNLLFSTYAAGGTNEGDSLGIWKIPGAVPGAAAEKIIDGSDIRECGVVNLGCQFGAPRLCVLTTGRYRGDLLVSGRGGIAIARAIGPDYRTLVGFIQAPQSTYQSGTEDPIPATLLDIHQVAATGDVLATDFINHRILQFDAEGRYLGVFCDLYRANRLASDYAGNVYATGSVWGSRSLQHIAGYSSTGALLFQLPIGDVVGVVILEE